LWYGCDTATDWGARQDFIFDFGGRSPIRIGAIRDRFADDRIGAAGVHNYAPAEHAIPAAVTGVK
jgi:hypothetical protein